MSRNISTSRTFSSPWIRASVMFAALALVVCLPAMIRMQITASAAVAQAGCDLWESKAPLQKGRFGLAAAINGKLYAVGGLNINVWPTLEAYDPQTDTWTTKASMPTPRYDLAAAAIDGKLYALGGNNYGGYLSTLEVYDPIANIWMTKAGMPTPRYFLAAAELDGKLYAAGGFNDNYAPLYPRWKPFKWLPISRSQSRTPATSRPTLTPLTL